MGSRSRRAEKVRQPRGLQLVHRNRPFDTSGLVPDAKPDVRVLVDVSRHAQRFAGIAFVRWEELHQLAPERRGAPGTEAKPLLDAAPALCAGLHAHSLIS